MTDKNKLEFYLLLGKQLTAFRKAKDLSQAQVAKIIGMSRVSMVNIEKGRQTPPIHILWVLSKLYEVSLDELISLYQKSDASIEDRATLKQFEIQTSRSSLSSTSISLLKEWVSDSEE